MSEWVERCDECGAPFKTTDQVEWRKPKLGQDCFVRTVSGQTSAWGEVGMLADRITVTCINGHDFDAIESEWRSGHGRRFKPASPASA